MENTIKAKVPVEKWSKATTLANSIQTACAGSENEFKFTVALIGEKKIPAGGTSAVTSYFVNAKIGYESGGFSSVQSLEDAIYSACDANKKTGEEFTFKTYTGLRDSAV